LAAAGRSDFNFELKTKDCFTRRLDRNDFFNFWGSPDKIWISYCV